MSDTSLNNSYTMKVNGEEYTLKFTFNALNRVEPQLSKKSLIAVLAMFADSTPEVTDIFKLFKESVRAGTPSMAGKPESEFQKLWVDMVNEYGIQRVVEAVTYAIMASGIIGSKKETAAILRGLGNPDR